MSGLFFILCPTFTDSFESSVANGEIAHDLWPQCFQRYRIIMVSYVNMFYFLIDLFIVVCYRCVVCEKGLMYLNIMCITLG